MRFIGLTQSLSEYRGRGSDNESHIIDALAELNRALAARFERAAMELKLLASELFKVVAGNLPVFVSFKAVR